MRLYPLSYSFFSTDSNPHPATDSFMDYVYYHWSNHPFIRGGYSSSTAHTQGMRHALASPVEDRLFFAGEATSLTTCATVHTAMETRFRAAYEVFATVLSASTGRSRHNNPRFLSVYRILFYQVSLIVAWKTDLSCIFCRLIT